MLVTFGPRHPRVIYEHEPLGPGRDLIAVFALVMFILCFTPVPSIARPRRGTINSGGLTPVIGLGSDPLRAQGSRRSDPGSRTTDPGCVRTENK